MRFTLDIFAIAVGLFLAQELFRRRGPNVGWLAFVVAPLCLTPVWIGGELTALLRQAQCPIAFAWIKLYSILGCAAWGTAIRRTALGRRSWARWAVIPLLVLNFLEPIVQSGFGFGIAHYLNAAAGTLLVAAIPYDFDAIQIDRAGRYRDLVCPGISRGWIVGYTLWNWTFVYLNYPLVCGQHLAVLGVALAIGLFRPAMWLQTRTYTLAAWLITVFSAPCLIHRIDTSDWSRSGIELVVAASSFGFTFAYLLAARCRLPSIATLGKHAAALRRAIRGLPREYAS
jgi:hypothetical protein